MDTRIRLAEGFQLAGHDDWRLPNAKQLQSILDYTRSPVTHGTAAIDPVFNFTPITHEEGGSDFPFYWTSTTHVNMSDSYYGKWASYVCFGTAYGYMTSPHPPFATTFMDVHGASAQRSDPKYDDGTDYSTGHGPQGDVVRIYNHVRCVRDVAVCGDDAHPFPAGDLTLDCSVNLFDLDISVLTDLASTWLNCTRPDAQCDQ